MHNSTTQIHLKFDVNQMYRTVLESVFQRLGLAYHIPMLNEVDIQRELNEEEIQMVAKALEPYGIEMIDNKKSVLVQKIKNAIIEMVYFDDKLPTIKISNFLAEKFNHSYGYLANVFSEVTFTSIENFIILQKIEFVKKLLLENEMNLTEISYRLNYSSVSHLSKQFKNTTGLTPSAFVRIMEKRKDLIANHS